MIKSFFLGLHLCWGLFGWDWFDLFNRNFFYDFFYFDLLLDLCDVLALFAYLNGFFLGLTTLFGLFLLFNFEFFDHFLIVFELKLRLLQLLHLTSFLYFFSLNTLVSDKTLNFRCLDFFFAACCSYEFTSNNSFAYQRLVFGFLNIK
jgi:hypothetical protein